jgi:ABC-2 type transport system permease protein
MTALTHHFAYEFKTGLRNTTLLLMNYLFPMVFYAMMGLVMTQINPGFQEVLIPAMVLFAAMASTLLGLPGPLVESREAGIYRSYKINGVPAASILLTPALTTAFHVLIVAAIIALTGRPLFGGAAPLDWGAFILVTILSVLSFTGLGALIGVIAGDSRAVVLLSQLIFLPSMLLGGLMMPLDVLPESIRSVSLFLPVTHAMESFMGYAYGQGTVVAPLYSVLALASSGLLAFGLAVFLFNWDSRNNTRRGHPLLALLALAPYVVVVLSQL